MVKGEGSSGSSEQQEDTSESGIDGANKIDGEESDKKQSDISDNGNAKAKEEDEEDQAVVTPTKRAGSPRNYANKKLKTSAEVFI